MGNPPRKLNLEEALAMYDTGQADFINLGRYPQLLIPYGNVWNFYRIDNIRKPYYSLYCSVDVGKSLNTLD